MSELIFTFNAVIPLFLIVVVGVVLKRALHIESKQASFLNRICYYTLIPCSLLNSAYKCDFSQIKDVFPYLYGAATFLICTPLLLLLARKLTDDNRKAGSFTNSAFRPNCVLLGIPLAIDVLGETNALPAVLMAMALPPLLNALGVFILSYSARREKRIPILPLLRSVVTNPLIISILLGFGLNALKLPLPSLIASPITKLAVAASPLAMLSIGLSFEVMRIKNDMKLVLTASVIKVILLPLVFTLIAVLLGFRGNELFAIYLIHAVPTAANAGVIADSMGCDGTLAGEIVLVTTIASAFTLVGGIMLLRVFVLL